VPSSDLVTGTKWNRTRLVKGITCRWIAASDRI